VVILFVLAKEPQEGLKSNSILPRVNLETSEVMVSRRNKWRTGPIIASDDLGKTSVKAKLSEPNKSDRFEDGLKIWVSQASLPIEILSPRAFPAGRRAEFITAEYARLFYLVVHDIQGILVPSKLPNISYQRGGTKPTQGRFI